jgi:hypothetical protein
MDSDGPYLGGPATMGATPRREARLLMWRRFRGTGQLIAGGVPSP